jgi:hypothetical protein
MIILVCVRSVIAQLSEIKIDARARETANNVSTADKWPSQSIHQMNGRKSQIYPTPCKAGNWYSGARRNVYSKVINIDPETIRRNHHELMDFRAVDKTVSQSLWLVSIASRDFFTLARDSSSLIFIATFSKASVFN